MGAVVAKSKKAQRAIVAVKEAWKRIIESRKTGKSAGDAVHSFMDIQDRKELFKKRFEETVIETLFGPHGKGKPSVDKAIREKAGQIFENILGPRSGRKPRINRRIEQQTETSKKSKETIRQIDAAVEKEFSTSGERFDPRAVKSVMVPNAKERLRRLKKEGKPSIPQGGSRESLASKIVNAPSPKKSMQELQKSKPKVTEVDLRKTNTRKISERKTSERKTTTRQRTGVGSPSIPRTTRRQRVQGIKSRIIRQSIADIIKKNTGKK